MYVQRHGALSLCAPARPTHLTARPGLKAQSPAAADPAANRFRGLRLSREVRNAAGGPGAAAAEPQPTDALLPARLPPPPGEARPPSESARCSGERPPDRALPRPALPCPAGRRCRVPPARSLGGAGGPPAARPRPARALMGLAEPAPWRPCTRARTRPLRPRPTSCWR